MTEPRRLKEEDGFGAALLRSAQDDGPSAHARRAIAATIGVAGVTAAANGAGTAAAATTASAPAVGGVVAGAAPTALVAKASVSLVAKLLIGLAVTTGVGVGVGVVVQQSSSSSSSGTREPTRRSTPEAPAPVAAHVAAPVALTPTVEAAPPVTTASVPAVGSARATNRVAPLARSKEPAIEPRPAPSVTPEVAPPAEAPPAAAVARPTPAATLSDEVALLDDAVAALRRGEGAAALLMLDRYDRKFPQGVLNPEATVARIEALVAIGDLARARTIAARFLAANGDSPLAHRVRQSLPVK